MFWLWSMFKSNDNGKWSPCSFMSKTPNSSYPVSHKVFPLEEQGLKTFPVSFQRFKMFFETLPRSLERVWIHSYWFNWDCVWRGESLNTTGEYFSCVLLERLWVIVGNTQKSVACSKVEIKAFDQCTKCIQSWQNGYNSESNWERLP